MTDKIDNSLNHKIYKNKNKKHKNTLERVNGIITISYFFCHLLAIS